MAEIYHQQQGIFPASLSHERTSQQLPNNDIHEPLLKLKTHSLSSTSLSHELLYLSSQVILRKIMPY